MLLDTTPAAEAAPWLNAPAPLKTRGEAVERYGLPTLRQPLADGGERLRWIRLHETILATMDVKTIDVDVAGRVVQASVRTVRVKDPAAY
jgi:hypothetical protein